MPIVAILGIFTVGAVMLRFVIAMSWVDALIGAAVVMVPVAVVAHTRSRHSQDWVASAP